MMDKVKAIMEACWRKRELMVFDPDLPEEHVPMVSLDDLELILTEQLGEKKGMTKEWLVSVIGKHMTTISGKAYTMKYLPDKWGLIADEILTEQLGERDEHGETLRDKAKALYDGGMRCNCDLDNWQPEPDTGHSWVCRIHKAVKDGE